ncbi:MAG TPA: hypothetical protein PLP17_02950 [Oligoflexia bacterium]|nr:hypothetical protein [Oligoflexia bacterium]
MYRLTWAALVLLLASCSSGGSAKFSNAPKQDKAPANGLLAHCTEVASESSYCTALVSDTMSRPALIGLDSGRVCLADQQFQYDLSHSSSLALDGDALYTCRCSENITQINLTTGRRLDIFVGCTGIAVDDGQPIVYHPQDSEQQLRRYDSFDALIGGLPPQVLPGGLPVESIAAHKGVLYGAWHSADRIQRLPIGQDVPGEIVLENYDDWIRGLDVLENGTLVVVKGIAGQELAFFDAATGRHLRDLPLALDPRYVVAGIQCASN